MTIWPLYSGLVRSFQVSGFEILRFLASTVLKQMVAPQTFMPHQAGGLALSRYWGMMASKFSGANGSSMPFFFIKAKLVAATPMTASACGLDFSANNLAVITPVESRTHLMSISG